MTKPINDHILDAFRQSGVTRYRLAKETGIANTTILRWVQSENSITVGNLQAIADFLGVVITATRGTERVTTRAAKQPEKVPDPPKTRRKKR